jgi:chemotaxis protein methyltransferase CheR
MSNSTQISTLIKQRTGLDVATQFRADLETILRDLAKGDLEQYLADLRASNENMLPWQELMRALTISETYFFRDTAPFQLLRQHILPNIILQRRLHKRLDLNIWSAGCSTGEEAYSIAILLYELLPDLDNWTIRLKASDINNHALQIAHQGIYREWAFRHTNSGFQSRYFNPVSGGWQIKTHIQQMASFSLNNLFNEMPRPQFDIIFCRNVLLYIANDFTKAVETLIFESLVPGGWLILGQSEAIRWQRERWATHVFTDATLYQKPLSQQTITPPPRYPISLIMEVPDYELALNALYNERSAEAETILNGILAEKPSHAPTHILLAYVLGNRHALESAHHHLDAALNSDGMLADAHYLRATLFLEEGKDVEAREALRAALYCQRDHPLAALMLGNLYASIGDMEKASRTWENARQAVMGLPSETRFSVLSDMTTSGFEALVKGQLDNVNKQRL